MYIMTPSDICLTLDVQDACRALARAWAKTGKRIAARMAIMAMTTSNSISVKPLCFINRLLVFVRRSDQTVESVSYNRKDAHSCIFIPFSWSHLLHVVV